MIVDLIIIAIVIIAVLIGRKRGLTICLVNILSLIVALILAFMLCKPVASYVMEKTKIGDNLKETIKNNIPMSDTEFDIKSDSNLPEGIKNYIDTTTTNINETKDQGIDNISTELAKEVITVVAFILIFIIARAILLIVKVLSKLINKLPILKQIDHLGGAICGLAEGILVVYSAFAIITVISPVLKDTQILTQINSSYLGKTMYNDNIITSKIYNK